MADIDIETILGLEAEIWEALCCGDARKDAELLSGEFLGVYETGYGDRSEHVAQLAVGATVAQYAIEQPRLLPLADGVVLLAYLAKYSRVASPEQDEAMWVSSIWRREGDGWRNVFSQDTARGGVRPV